MTDVDTDRLPPMQYLILEVLAARWRLGERLWTFPAARISYHLGQLEQLGLVGWKSGVDQGTVRAWLTEKGRAAALSDTYEPPAPPRPSAVCGRCTVRLHPDVWGKWVDDLGGRTCGGDRLHQPVGAAS
jgi:hypothetical protein